MLQNVGFGKPFNLYLVIDKNIEYSQNDWKKIIKSKLESNKAKCGDELSKEADYPTASGCQGSPLPTADILIKFAHKAYKNNGNLLDELPDGWELLTCTKNKTILNNYFGVAYYSYEKQHVVIAHRGTKFKLGALYTDYFGICYSKYVQQISSACTFTFEIVTELNELNKNHGTNFQLFFTGHSLGGWLAQITAFAAKYLNVRDGFFMRRDKEDPESYHAHAIVFESPGCKKTLQMMQSDFFPRHDNTDVTPISKMHIVNYLSVPNPINTVNSHIGQLNRVITDLTGFNRDSPILYCKKNTKITHKLKKMISAFSSESLKIKEVVDWPILKELTNFFSVAKYSFDLDPQVKTVKFNQKPIRYETKNLKEQECSVNVFTQEELLFMKKVHELRKLFGKNPQLKNNLIEGIVMFEIKHNKIICENKKALQELVPYVKTLLCRCPEVKENVNTAFDKLVSKKNIIELHSLKHKELADSYFHYFKDEIEHFKDIPSKSLIIVGSDCFLGLTRIYKAFQGNSKDKTLILNLEWLLTIKELLNETNTHTDFLMQQSLILVECTLKCCKPKELNETNLNERIERNSNFVDDFFDCLFKKIDSSRTTIILVASDDQYVTEKVKQNCMSRKALLTWDTLSSDFQREVSEKQLIAFKGQEKISLKQLTEKDEDTDKATKIIINLSPNVLSSLINNDIIEIDGLNLSRDFQHDFYLERTLKYQNKVKKEVIVSVLDSFTEEQTDILVFSNITKKEFIHNVFGKSFELKFDEFKKKNDGKVVYFLNNKKNRRSQFEHLCNSNNSSNVNIHWLKYDQLSKSFFWKKTQGSLNLIRNHLHHSYNTISEQNLVSQSLEDHKKVIIISDTAGMGKSMLLTHVQQLIKNKNPDLLVIKMNLNDYTIKLDEVKKEGGFNSDKAVEFMFTGVLNLTSLEQILLKYYCRVGKLVALFDGFDEISPNYNDVVISLIKALRHYGIDRIWITTRPKMKNNLEENFEQFAYTIEPLTKEEQRDFINKFMDKEKKKFAVLIDNDDEIKSLPENVIKEFEEFISGNKGTFAEVPLHSKMLAEVFCIKFKQDYESEKNRVRKPDSMTDLYKIFLENKYKIYLKEKVNLDITRPGAKALFNKKISNFIKKTQDLALYSIFKGENLKILRDIKCLLEYSNKKLIATFSENQIKLFVDEFGENMKTFINYIAEGNEDVGVIDTIIEDRPSFIHSSFAEYLVAKLLVNLLKQSSLVECLTPSFQKMVKLLLEDILFLSEYQVVRAFFNDLLNQKPFKQEYLSLFEKQIQILRKAGLKLSHYGQTVLHIAVNEKNLKIINFLLESLKNCEKEKTLLLSESDSQLYSYSDTVITTAIKLENLEICKLLLEKGADINSTKMYNENTLNLAVKARNYKIIKFLIEAGALYSIKHTNQDQDNKDIDTVLKLAKENNDTDIAEHLSVLKKKINGDYFA